MKFRKVGFGRFKTISLLKDFQQAKAELINPDTSMVIPENTDELRFFLRLVSHYVGEQECLPQGLASWFEKWTRQFLSMPSATVDAALVTLSKAPKPRGRPKSTQTRSIGLEVSHRVLSGMTMTAAVESVAVERKRDPSVVRKAYYKHKKQLDEFRKFLGQ